MLAVEGIDGTDATIMRGGRLCRQGAVIVKVSKPMQDLRFDVPAAGSDTVEVMKRVNARVLVLEAGRTLLFDRERTIDAADSAGISIVVQNEGFGVKDHQDDDALALLESNPPGRNGWGPVEYAQERAPVSSAVLVRAPRPGAIRTAVIGVGYLGRFHAQKYARLPEADLVAIVDIERGRAEKVAAEVGTSASIDYKELIGKVDAVSIVTPTPGISP